MKDMRDVVGYEGLYMVDPLGNVYSHYSKRILKPYTASDGYLRVNLCKDGKVKATMLHRIVAEAFIPNPKGLPVINHIDGNKANPHIENLEWVTHSENSKHAYDTGLMQISEKCRQAVSKIAAANGAKTTSKAVLQLDDEGNILRRFASIREAERSTKIPRQNIIRACKTAKYSAGGFRWQKE